jgi:RimJ/RimL family protein N-acetyltransferase
MFLRKYTDSDFPILKSWVTDPDLLFIFAGRDWSYPLKFEEVKAYQLAHPTKQSYVLCSDEGLPVAFGELINSGPNAPRLGRLLVGGKENRGKGIGKILIQSMIDESRKLNNQKFIHLLVFKDNFSAIRCYQNIGFHFVPDTVLPITRPDGTVILALLMTLTFND